MQRLVYPWGRCTLDMPACWHALPTASVDRPAGTTARTPTTRTVRRGSLPVTFCATSNLQIKSHFPARIARFQITTKFHTFAGTISNSVQLPAGTTRDQAHSSHFTDSPAGTLRDIYGTIMQVQLFTSTSEYNCAVDRARGPHNLLEIQIEWHVTVPAAGLESAGPGGKGDAP